MRHDISFSNMISIANIAEKFLLFYKVWKVIWINKAEDYYWRGKPYPCIYCEMFDHRGPFKCDYCQTGFCTFQGSISDHEVVHEQTNLEIPNIVGKFLLLYSVEKHMDYAEYSYLSSKTLSLKVLKFEIIKSKGLARTHILR